VTALVSRFRDGVVPRRGLEQEISASVREEVRKLAERDADGERRYRDAFDAFRPHDALAAVWETLAAANELVSRVAPWRLARDSVDSASFDEAVWWLVRTLARQAILLAPVLPSKSDELWRVVGGSASVHDQRLTDLDAIDPSGWIATAGGILFPRTGESGAAS
jgi:methionyl-tRNA synthetase